MQGRGLHCLGGGAEVQGGAYIAWEAEPRRRGRGRHCPGCWEVEPMSGARPWCMGRGRGGAEMA